MFFIFAFNKRQYQTDFRNDIALFYLIKELQEIPLPLQVPRESYQRRVRRPLRSRDVRRPYRQG